MKRKENWPEELTAFVELCELDEFVWGKTDCLHFANLAIRYITNVDIIKQFYPDGLAYKTEDEATEKMKEDFGGGLHEVVVRAAKQNGMEEISPPYAQRGDLAIMDTSYGDILGICLGAEFVGIGYEGLVYFPLASVKRAWRV